MGDQPIFTTKAHVFQIDPETKKKWLPVSTQAVAVSFYHDTARNSYRILSFDATNKFTDKFAEIKELVKASQQTVPHSNGTDSAIPAGHRVHDNVPVTEVKNEIDPVVSTPPAVGSTGSAANSQLAELRYENDRLKMALTQSAANAKKWEQDIQTLRSNNQRLTTALQESNINVEEWKKQLATYKEENAKMKAKLADTEKNSGNAELLQRQLLEAKARLEDSERLVAQKQEEVNDLKRKLDEMKQTDAQCQRLTAKIQALEEEKMKMRQQVTELQVQLETAQTLRSSSKQQLLTTQQQLSSKINELYEMNDKLADFLQSAAI